MSSPQKLARNIIVIFIAGFLALFIARLGYGYWAQPNGVSLNAQRPGALLNPGWMEFALGVKNYASLRRRKIQSAPQATPLGTGDQKYEKVASVALKSTAFEDDEARVRALIADHSALVQFEQREGLKGRRSLRLAIGVAPDAFDTFVDAIQTYGTLSALSINKSDKTNEYRELQAKRLSLEKTRAALAELKTRDGKISELIALEKQILELEQQIQGLGVSLGDFDSENEFVTVKMLMREVSKGALRSISFLRRSFAALSWTSWVYAFIWFGLACALIAGFIATHLLRIMISLASSAETAPNSRPQ